MEENINTHKFSDTLMYQLVCTAKLARLMGFRYFENCKDINITYNDAIIIDELYTNPDIHQRDLAKMLLIGTANLSRDLDKLEKRGLIKRNIATRGKRVVKTMVLTPEGKKVHHDIGIHAYNAISKIEEVFSKEEFENFITLLTKLKNRLVETNNISYE